MDVKYNDAVFGEMTYKHRWQKRQTICLFGENWEITVAARAYSGKAITAEQQNSYTLFMENEKKNLETVEKELKNYINSNLQDFAVNWHGARFVDSVDELSQLVTPKTLLFKQDGTVIMLLDCIWDIESGIAVKLIPDIAVGSQDMFL